MNPNKAKSFPAAIVPAVAKLGHRRRGKRGTQSEERRSARRAHASKRQCRRWRSRGVVGLPHPTRRKKEGTNLGRKHLEELSKRRRTFARKKRRGKRAERKSVRKNNKATRPRSRLEELTFGTFNVRTERSTTSMVPGTSTPCSKPAPQRVVTSSDCRRPKGTDLPKFCIWIPQFFKWWLQ